MTNKGHLRVAAVVPALNEALAIGAVVRGLLALRDDEGQLLIDRVVVCDNGSEDATGDIARRCGAEVVEQPQSGYGIACLTALAQLEQGAPVDVVLFVDGDCSCRLEQTRNLLAVLHNRQEVALVIGSRAMGKAEEGALTLPQRLGNQVAAFMILLLWKRKVTDLGPFRAIRYKALQQLEMRDQAYGWTVEMQVKAIQKGLHIVEVPIDSLVRLGKSKISGTVSGVIGAAIGILGKIAGLWYQQVRTPTENETRMMVSKKG